jgi:RNA polymerase sigma-70 factor (ECF subfamily)
MQCMGREPESTDAEVIARSVHEPGAFRVLFDRHFADVHRYLRHRAGPDLADDLAAETFVRAFAVRARFRPRACDTARAWLFTIATNLLHDEARRGRRRVLALGRLAAEPPPAQVEPLDERDPALAAALSALREEEREAVLLLAWGELSYEEIARVTGVRPGTVRSRLNRARARLQEALAPEALEEIACEH